jgi:hypothetical protein
VVSLRIKVFRTWLGWLAALAAAAALALSLAVIDPSGPLAPQGWLSYLLYPASIVWLVPAATVMIRPPRRAPGRQRPTGARRSNRPAHQVVPVDRRAARFEDQVLSDRRFTHTSQAEGPPRPGRVAVSASRLAVLHSDERERSSAGRRAWPESRTHRT